MLHNHKDSHCPEREKVMEPGKMKRVGAKEAFKILPNKVTNALQNKDIYEVLEMMQDKEIVLIFGIPGIGKSTLLKNLSWYTAERDFY